MTVNVGMMGKRGWIGARHSGVVTAVPVVVTFVDRVTGKIVCREEIGGGRHCDHRRAPTALYATENDARRALGLPPRVAQPQIAGEQLKLGAAT